MGSFAVEEFSIQGLVKIGPADVSARALAFQELVHFEIGPEHLGDAG